MERPAINRDEGATLAFSKARERKALNAPPEDTIAGLRDRAILSAAPHVRLRRAEIAALTDGDLFQNRGDDSLRVTRKRGRRDALAMNPQTAARIRAYLDFARHGADIDGPLFRPVKHNWKRRGERRAWTQTRSTAWCASMLASLGSTAIRNSERSQSPYHPAIPARGV